MKITLLGLCSILFMVPLISNSRCITTQGDTTFNVDEGDFFLWATTGGDKINLTIEEIYKGTYLSVDSYMINATIGNYYSQENFWWKIISNEFYIAANETLDFIHYSRLSGSLIYLIIPTPINLTMIGEHAISKPGFNNYTVSGDQITLIDFPEYPDHMVYIVTFNSDGILTKIVAKFRNELTEYEETYWEMVLSTGDEEAIPYGYFFMIFTLIGVISLVYLEKKEKLR
ncbi:MAG: hypothetical protein ACFFFT_06750 [Candidatus Thorarchaeota archaeon]